MNSESSTSESPTSQSRPSDEQAYAATPVRRLAMIVAASENGAIGLDGDMPWRLSSDLKRFKELTMGHTIIMGRKTFDSIGRLLPGRTTIIVTRNQDYEFDGALIAHSLEEALELAGDDPKPFIVGGAQLYELAMSQVTDIYLTRVLATIEGDTYLPEIVWAKFTQASVENYSKDTKNDFDTRYEVYVRNQQ